MTCLGFVCAFEPISLYDIPFKISSPYKQAMTDGHHNSLYRTQTSDVGPYGEGNVFKIVERCGTNFNLNNIFN